jgi:hypothetical protein
MQFRWQRMAPFALVENPVIAFIDNEDDLRYFRLVRSRLPANRTRFVLVERNRLWSFSSSVESRIAAIYRKPGYPKHYPNTVMPLYSMSMYAKYEVSQVMFLLEPN